MELIAETVMDITSVIINDDSSMVCFEGNVGKYGRVFANHTYIPNTASKNSGKFYGEARTIMEDGTMVSASLQECFAGTEERLTSSAWMMRATEIRIT
jgi:hypothetical protein